VCILNAGNRVTDAAAEPRDQPGAAMGVGAQSAILCGAGAGLKK
jgi:hypothetical protein